MDHPDLPMFLHDLRASLAANVQHAMNGRACYETFGLSDGSDMAVVFFVPGQISGEVHKLLERLCGGKGSEQRLPYGTLEDN